MLSEDLVIEEIREVGLQSLPMALSDLLLLHRGLVTRGCAVFGTWRNAIEACGGTPEFVLETPRFKLRKKRAEVVIRLCDWMRQHGPLYEGGLASSDPELLQETTSLLGELEEAAAKFGLPIVHSETFDRLVCMLCGEQLGSMTSHLVRKHKVSVSEYRSRFGLVHMLPQKARQAISSRRGGTRAEALDAHQILAKLRAYNQEKSPVTSSWLAKHDHPLLKLTHHLFGGLHAALDAAGLPKTEINTWSKKRVVAELKKRVRNCPPEEAYERLRFSVMQKEAFVLYEAAYRHFGSWLKALDAAGLPGGRVSLAAMKPQVIEDLKAWADKHETHTPSHLRETDPELADRVRRVFTTFRAAAIASGLPVQELRSWSPAIVVARMQEIHSPGTEMTPSVAEKSAPGISSAARRYFGSWSKARDAAGIRGHLNSAELKAELEKWSAVHGPVHSRALQDSGGTLYRKLMKRYGSLITACKALSVEYRKPSRLWSKDRVVSEILRLKGEGEGLNARNIHLNHVKLEQAAKRYFGPWDTALEAAGLDPDEHRQLRPVWTEESLEQAINEWVDHYGPLVPKKLTQTNKPLYTALKYRFSSIESAAQHFNVPYKVRQTTKSLSKEDTVARILQRVDEGLLLSYKQIKEDDAHLFYAVHKHFGNVTKMKRELGLG